MKDDLSAEELVEYAKRGLGLFYNKKSSRAMLGRELGVRRRTVGRWATGESRPTPPHMIKLQILANFWIEFVYKRSIIERKLKVGI